MYEAFQKSLEELLTSSSSDKTTLIKLFDGISIEITPRHEETRFLPLIQEERLLPERIRISANITQHYKIKINEMWANQKNEQ